LPLKFHPKPPHEIVAEAMSKLSKRLDAIEARLEKIEKKL